MHYRYTVSKNFDNGVVTKTSTKNGIPIYSSIISKYSKLDDKDYDVSVLKGVPDSISFSETVKVAKSFLESDKALRLLTFTADNSEIVPLSQQFDFVFGKSFNSYDLNMKASDSYKEGSGLWDILNDRSYIEKLNNCVRSMFPYIVPSTGKKDIDSDRFFTHMIPLVCMSGCILPQSDENGQQYFNSDGSVTVAEFLDSLNAIKFGCNSNTNREISKDNVSCKDDYFNMGYNSCLSGLASPFYRLYTRSELIQPITRLELAYITVVCWEDFTKKYGNIYGGRYRLGLNVDWENPSRYASNFEDGSNYKVIKKVTADEYKIVSIDLHNYIQDSITDFKLQLKTGKRGIPLPMFMCLFELNALDLFYFEDRKLDPLKEVSRGELTYFIVKLAREFSIKFVSSGDNSYM